MFHQLVTQVNYGKKKPHASLGIQCNRDLEDSQHYITKQRTFNSAGSKQQFGDRTALIVILLTNQHHKRNTMIQILSQISRMTINPTNHQ